MDCAKRPSSRCFLVSVASLLVSPVERGSCVLPFAARWLHCYGSSIAGPSHSRRAVLALVNNCKNWRLLKPVSSSRVFDSLDHDISMLFAVSLSLKSADMFLEVSILSRQPIQTLPIHAVESVSHLLSNSSTGCFFHIHLANSRAEGGPYADATPVREGWTTKQTLALGSRALECVKTSPNLSWLGLLENMKWKRSESGAQDHDE